MLYTLYTLTKHFHHWFVIPSKSPICSITKNLQTTESLEFISVPIKVKARWHGTSCVISRNINSTANSKLMTAIKGTILFSTCLTCGETEGRLSCGLWPATSLPACHSDNKQRGSGQCAISQKCTNDSQADEQLTCDQQICTVYFGH